jgi:biopolymer transport protein ExbD
MIPMIDLLMVTVSFLLITAVWVRSSRMDSSAQAPGNAETPPCEEGGCKAEPKLHVMSSDPTKFVLAWKEGTTTVRSIDVPREQHASRGTMRFPTLAERVAAEWRDTGRHRDSSDRRFDQAVVHASNEMPYGELVAVMDAVAMPKRALSVAGKAERTSAFEITFATD